jgi:PKHD-type hydroxylase
MRSMWQMWKNYMPDSQCDKVVEQALKITPVQATTYGNVPDLRRSKIRWIQKSDADWDWLFRDIEYVIKRANTAFGFDINLFHEIQFTEYDSAYTGYYGWHEDLRWIPQAGSNSQRKLSFVLQLSDPSTYTGGDLEFQMNEQSPMPADLRVKGTTIVFPSFIKHRVVPVTSGTRYSLVTWYEGPPFK